MFKINGVPARPSRQHEPDRLPGQERATKTTYVWESGPMTSPGYDRPSVSRGPGR